MQEIIAEVLNPGHFWVRPPARLRYEHVTEQIPWEIFRGRLLDASQTRQRRSFVAWNLFLDEEGAKAEAPVLSIKHDAASGRLHVTRGLRCYAWEAYDSGDNVVLSREIIKWVRELVGSIELTRKLDPAALREELASLLFQAVVGTSRLPLTSVESPLPAFSLGELGYFFRPDAAQSSAFHSWQILLEQRLYAEQSWREKTKLLELLLRAVPAAEVADLAQRFAARWRAAGGQVLPLLRSLFDEAALTPYTSFVEQTLTFVNCLVENGALAITELVDFLGGLLRQLGRHLTAYDLVTFHHAGANYPDALLLDAVLKTYLALAERQPESFEGSPGRLRRRALRQGWLLRRFYEGHLVPDAPTSPGENARLLPPPHSRVPDEQLTQPARRHKRLYDGDALPAYLGPRSRLLLRQSIHDLNEPVELRELGMAVFVERPLSINKAVGEPDQTLLLAQEGFSKIVAGRRLTLLRRDPETGLSAEEESALKTQLDALEIPGVPAAALATPRRPVVSLVDALRISGDFVFLRTLPRGLADFLQEFDCSPLPIDLAQLLSPPRRCLVLRLAQTAHAPECLAIFDKAIRKRLELEVNEPKGYVRWGGKEYPVGGLRVLRIWDANGREDLKNQPIVLRARVP